MWLEGQYWKGGGVHVWGEEEATDKRYENTTLPKNKNKHIV